MWSSDGTAEGTSAVFQASPVSPPVHLTSWKERLYFLAPGGPDNPAEVALWVSDGEGASLVVRLGVDVTELRQSDLATTDDTVYILLNNVELVAYSPNLPLRRVTLHFPAASLGSAGGRAILELRLSQTELWSSDGTVAGTVKLRTFGDYINEVRTVGDHFFFSIGSYFDYNLWVTDGSAAGTSARVGGLKPLRSPTVEHDGKLVFTTAYADVWISDGTNGGTVRFATFPQIAEELVSTPSALYAITRPGNDSELWRLKEGLAPVRIEEPFAWITAAAAFGSQIAVVGSQDLYKPRSLAVVDGAGVRVLDVSRPASGDPSLVGLDDRVVFYQLEP